MKRAFFTSPLWRLAPVCVLSLAGCGGGGTSPDPGTSGPSIVDNALTSDDFRDIQDDRFYDIFICDVTRNGVANVELRSLDFDATVLVYRRDSGGDLDLIAENDDLSGTNSNARVEFDVSRGGSYRIIATSARQDERGEYSLFLSEILGRPARVLPDANRTAQSLRLPPIKDAKK